MLVLSRRPGERIRIRTPAGEVVWITVSSWRGDAVRLGFTADAGVEIMREELLIPPEVREARLRGYEGEPCPHCRERKTVRSGNQYACDGCGQRWEGK